MLRISGDRERSFPFACEVKYWRGPESTAVVAALEPRNCLSEILAGPVSTRWGPRWNSVKTIPTRLPSETLAGVDSTT
jgi:hypothetical protein